jgi:hypothetical protein
MKETSSCPEPGRARDLDRPEHLCNGFEHQSTAIPATELKLPFMLGHVDHEVHKPARITPLVVIPRDEFVKTRVQ